MKVFLCINHPEIHEPLFPANKYIFRYMAMGRKYNVTRRKQVKYNLNNVPTRFTPIKRAINTPCSAS